VLEVDDENIAPRIENAEDCISPRLQSDGKHDLEESQALFDAIHCLHVPDGKIAKWPQQR